jgi:general secretion pathway protein A
MYNKFYGFSEKPFELTPDPKFLYFTPSHRKALGSMIYGIKERISFISMTGEVGTGKTTLIYYLFNSLDEKVKTVFIFHTTITFKDLLKTILLDLDVKVVDESKMGLLNQLIQYLTQMDARDETLAIIIDEAQNLPREVMEELKMFSNLESKLLQIVLVGQPELEEKLNSSEGLRQLKQNIGIRDQIRALSGEESKEYIDHRLRLVGSSSFETFTPKAISMICLHAKGIPRMINILCDNALRIGYSLSQKRIDVDIIHEVIKEMEGPSMQKEIPSSATVVNKSGPFPFRLNFFLNKTSIAILCLLCLGVIILLAHGYLQRRPTKMSNIKSLKDLYVDSKPSSPSPPPQKKTEGLSKEEVRHPLGESEIVSSEFLQSASPPSSSFTTSRGEDKLKGVMIVKEGQTISYLTLKYYRMVNQTLIDLVLDFNPEIKNVHLILVDQEIRIPNITEELLIIRSPDSSYKIHLGTFQTPEPARLFRDEPVLKGKKIEVLPRKVSPQEIWYRMVIGEFNDKDEVLKVIHLLKGKGLLPAFGGLSKIE